MFMEKALKRTVSVHPRAVHPNGQHRREVVVRLMENLRQEEFDEAGGFYYVAPTTLTNMSPGRVVPGTGEVRFTVEFSCIIFKLFRYEVTEVELVRVESAGCDAKCGPFDNIFLPAVFFRTGFLWNKTLGCFVSVGLSEECMLQPGSRVVARMVSVKPKGWALAELLALSQAP